MKPAHTQTKQKQHKTRFTTRTKKMFMKKITKNTEQSEDAFVIQGRELPTKNLNRDFLAFIYERAWRVIVMLERKYFYVGVVSIFVRFNLVASMEILLLCCSIVTATVITLFTPIRFHALRQNFPFSFASTQRNVPCVGESVEGCWRTRRHSKCTNEINILKRGNCNGRQSKI